MTHGAYTSSHFDFLLLVREWVCCENFSASLGDLDYRASGLGEQSSLLTLPQEARHDLKPFAGLPRSEHPQDCYVSGRIVVAGVGRYAIEYDVTLHIPLADSRVRA